MRHALLCACCGCPSLQQRTIRADPESSWVGRAAAQRTCCTGHPPRQANTAAGSQPGLEVSITSQGGTKSLRASRKPLTLGLSNPLEALEQTTFPQRSASPVPRMPGAQQCCSNLAPGGVPRCLCPPRGTPVLLQPGTWRCPRCLCPPHETPPCAAQAHRGDTCSTHYFQLYLPGLRV